EAVARAQAQQRARGVEEAARARRDGRVDPPGEHRPQEPGLGVAELKAPAERPEGGVAGRVRQGERGAPRVADRGLASRQAERAQAAEAARRPLLQDQELAAPDRAVLAVARAVPGDPEDAVGPAA